MVNTFLPEIGYYESLTRLDQKRLGKQRVETMQILKALRGETKGWRTHPAARMWQGYEGSLCAYGLISCRVWRTRGYADSLLPYFTQMLKEYPDRQVPWWHGIKEFHRSHQSNLIRKDPGRYSLMWPGVPADLPYYWPVSRESHVV
jgi:hypothetical protein